MQFEFGKFFNTSSRKTGNVSFEDIRFLFRDVIGIAESVAGLISGGAVDFNNIPLGSIWKTSSAEPTISSMRWENDRLVIAVGAPDMITSVALTISTAGIEISGTGGTNFGIISKLPFNQVEDDTLISKRFADSRYQFSAPVIVTTNIIWQDNNGSDDNDGSFGSKVLTADRCIELAVYGTTIMFGNGEVAAPTLLNKSGIVFKSIGDRTALTGAWIINGSVANAISFDNLLLNDEVDNITVDILNNASVNFINTTVTGNGQAGDTVIRVTDSSVTMHSSETDTFIENANDGNAILAVNSAVICIGSILNGVVNIDSNSLFLHTSTYFDTDAAIIAGTNYAGDSLAMIRAITPNDVVITDKTKGFVMPTRETGVMRRLVLHDDGTITTEVV